jgi:hypothetical protein
MKRFITMPLFAAALAMATTPVAAQVGSNSAPQRMQGRTDSGQAEAPAQRIALPPPEAMIILIRSSLVALGQANQTGNYTVLNQLGSANFRRNNTPERLSQIFAPFRTNNIDLSVVVFVTPQLTEAPRFENGRLRLIGYFPTQPMRVTFDLMFEPDNGQWKLFGLGVDLERVAAANSPQPIRQPAPSRVPAPAASDSR